MSDCDILFIERPVSQDYVIAAQAAKDFNVKLWIDFDDDLFSVPSWNPAHSFFSSKETKESIKKCLKIADIVTVATPKIKEVYENYTDNIIVVENAFNDYNFDFKNIKTNSNKIYWRGSQTHRKDIIDHSQSIVKASLENKDWEWNFIGNNLWFITEYIKNCKEYQEMELIKYFKLIKQLGPQIYIVPLRFCNFNLSKSNCGWLEATYAGATTIAPDIQEFRRPGIVNYKDTDDFYVKLCEMMNDKKELKRLHLESFEYIKDNLLLSKINNKRLSIIESIC